MFLDALYPEHKRMLKGLTERGADADAVVISDFLTSLAVFSPVMVGTTATRTLGWDLVQTVFGFLDRLLNAADIVVVATDKSEWVGAGKWVTQVRRTEASNTSVDRVSDECMAMKQQLDLAIETAEITERYARESWDVSAKKTADRQYEHVEALEKRIDKKEGQLQRERTKQAMRDEFAVRLSENPQPFADHLTVPLPWEDAPRRFRAELLSYLSTSVVLNYRPPKGKIVIIDGHYLDCRGMQKLLEKQLAQALYHHRHGDHVAIARRNLELYNSKHFADERGPSEEDDVKCRSTPLVVFHSNADMDPDAIHPPSEPRGTIADSVVGAYKQRDEALSRVESPDELTGDNINPFWDTRVGGFERIRDQSREVWRNNEDGTLFYEDPCAFNSQWAQASWLYNELGEADHVIWVYVHFFWTNWLRKMNVVPEQEKEKEARSSDSSTLPELSEYSQLVKEAKEAPGKTFYLLSKDSDIVRDSLVFYYLRERHKRYKARYWPKIFVTKHIGLASANNNAPRASMGFSVRDILELYQCLSLDLRCRMHISLRIPPGESILSTEHPFDRPDASTTEEEREMIANYRRLLEKYEEKAPSTLLGHKAWVESLLEREQEQPSLGRFFGSVRAVSPVGVPDDQRSPRHQDPMGTFLAGILSEHDYSRPYSGVPQTRFLQAVMRFGLYIGDVLVDSSVLSGDIEVDGQAYIRLVRCAYWMAYRTNLVFCREAPRKSARRSKKASDEKGAIAAEQADADKKKGRKSVHDVYWPWEMPPDQMRNLLENFHAGKRRAWNVYVTSRTYPEERNERRLFGAALDRRFPAREHLALRAEYLLYAVQILQQQGDPIPTPPPPLGMAPIDPDAPMTKHNIRYLSDNIGQWGGGLPDDYCS